jgi:CBS domain-containing protein
MNENTVCGTTAFEISEDDIIDAMKAISGYLDITPTDFKEIYTVAYRHAVSRATRDIRARDIMTRTVIHVGENEGLATVADIMAENGITGLPVVNGEKRVIGMLSEKDFLADMGIRENLSFMTIISQCLHHTGCMALPLSRKKAGDLMSTPVISVGETTPLADIARIFDEKNINRVPVLNPDATLCGIITRGDIVRACCIKGC